MTKKTNSFIKILVIILFGLFTLTGCFLDEEPNSSGSNPNSSGENTNSSEKKINNVTSSAELAKNGNLVVFVSNKNKNVVDMEIEVEYYDEKGTIVGSSSENLSAVGSGRDIAVYMYNTPKQFDNYKIYVDTKLSTYKTYFDQIEVIDNDNGDKVAVQVKNNSSDEIDEISLLIVYYLDGKVIGYDDDLEFSIKSGRSANYNLDYPYDKKYNQIKFDKYKVFVNEAYSYDY